MIALLAQANDSLRGGVYVFITLLALVALVAWLWERLTKGRCPHCRRSVKVRAVRCHHCHADILR